MIRLVSTLSVPQQKYEAHLNYLEYIMNKFEVYKSVYMYACAIHLVDAYSSKVPTFPACSRFYASSRLRLIAMYVYLQTTFAWSPWTAWTSLPVKNLPQRSSKSRSMFGA